VQYQLTPLGQTLREPLQELHKWTLVKLPEVTAAREAFDSADSGRKAADRSLIQLRL